MPIERSATWEADTDAERPDGARRSREGAGAGFASQRAFAGAWRHIGLYAYRGGALRRFAAAPVAALERIERLEQLRALELGLVIVVAEARELPGPHVDTPEHLAAVRRLMG